MYTLYPANIRHTQSYTSYIHRILQETPQSTAIHHIYTVYRQRASHTGLKSYTQNTATKLLIPLYIILCIYYHIRIHSIPPTSCSHRAHYIYTECRQQPPIYCYRSCTHTIYHHLLHILLHIPYIQYTSNILLILPYNRYTQYTANDLIIHTLNIAANLLIYIMYTFSYTGNNPTQDQN